MDDRYLKRIKNMQKKKCDFCLLVSENEDEGKNSVASRVNGSIHFHCGPEV
jgi:hypothetical protein